MGTKNVRIFKTICREIYMNSIFYFIICPYISRHPFKNLLNIYLIILVFYLKSELKVEALN